jgi:hypothetical protein
MSIKLMSSVAGKYWSTMCYGNPEKASFYRTKRNKSVTNKLETSHVSIRASQYKWRRCLIHLDTKCIGARCQDVQRQHVNKISYLYCDSSTIFNIYLVLRRDERKSAKLILGTENLYMEESSHTSIDAWVSYAMRRCRILLSLAKFLSWSCFCIFFSVYIWNHVRFHYRVD